ncbi:MAG TPA: hypothetical protein VG890_14330, partial [Puia sp.]|nr:hypothetical protein [Puia sp.]
TFKDMLYTFDTHKGTQTSKTMDRGASGQHHFLIPPQTIWFEKTLVTPLLFGTSLSSTLLKTILQSQPYE